jgi:hypothetical protein
MTMKPTISGEASSIMAGVSEFQLLQMVEDTSRPGNTNWEVAMFSEPH